MNETKAMLSNVILLSLQSDTFVNIYTFRAHSQRTKAEKIKIQISKKFFAFVSLSVGLNGTLGASGRC